jgi:hypothetical protein
VSDSQNQQGDLWLSLEGVCLGLTHDKVMTSLAEFTRDKEQSLTALCHRLVRPASSSTSPSFGGMHGASGAPLSSQSSSSSSSLASSIEAALSGSSARRGTNLVSTESPPASYASSRTSSMVMLLFGGAGGGGGGGGGGGSASGSSNGNSPRSAGSGSSSPSTSSSSSFLPFAAPPRLDRDSSFSLESLGLRTPLCGLDVSAAIDRLIALNAPARCTPVSRLVVLKVCHGESGFALRA